MPFLFNIITRSRHYMPGIHRWIGEGNGNPLQCSCLENPRDGGAWWAAVYGVAQTGIWLKWLGRTCKMLSGVITCLSLSTSEVAHLFMCLSATHVFFLCQIPFVLFSTGSCIFFIMVRILCNYILLFCELHLLLVFSLCFSFHFNGIF